MVQTNLTSWLKKPVAENPIFPPEPATLPPNGAESAFAAAQQVHHSSQEAEQSTTKKSDQVNPLSKPFQIPKRPLPPNLELVPITRDILPSFRRLNSLLLPVPYSDKFYVETVTDSVARRISLAALWHDITSSSNSTAASKSRLVGGIRCRLLSPQPPASPDAPPTLYISTVCVLAPYRRFGIAAALLRRVTAQAAHEHGVRTVTAHVWEASTEAKEWYKRMGFREVRFEEGYYRRLKPGGAWLVERRVGVWDLLGESDREGDGEGVGMG